MLKKEQKGKKTTLMEEKTSEMDMKKVANPYKIAYIKSRNLISLGIFPFEWFKTVRWWKKFCCFDE